MKASEINHLKIRQENERLKKIDDRNDKIIMFLLVGIMISMCVLGFLINTMGE